jgi:phage terminase large subunit-like protein
MTSNVNSLRQKLKDCSARGEGKKLSRILKLEEVVDLNNQWLYWARPDQQLPPAGTEFRNWLVLGGRGAGKTRAGAEWVKALALGIFEPVVRRCERIAIVAPTYDEARLVMIEGQSGLLSVHFEGERPRYEPSKRTVTWKNGSIAQVFSAEEPDSLRGPQFDAVWCDELAKWKHGEAAWMNVQMALRLGEVPQAVITTTPRPTKLIRELINDAATVVTRSRTIENAHNLASSFFGDVMARYGGTTLARQELDGELIADDPDALWRRDMIELFRLKEVPALKRIVVAVDPPATSSAKSNACGIVCVGLGTDGRCYVLEDASVKRMRPLQWAERVVRVARRWNADRVVAEVNQGGEMVRELLKQVDATLPIKSVHATRAKQARAEPVAALYEQGRVSHVGGFAALEDEMCAAIGEGASPDRLDALVWAVTELMLKKMREPRVRNL